MKYLRRQVEKSINMRLKHTYKLRNKNQGFRVLIVFFPWGDFLATGDNMRDRYSTLLEGKSKENEKSTKYAACTHLSCRIQFGPSLPKHDLTPLDDFHLKPRYILRKCVCSTRGAKRRGMVKKKAYGLRLAIVYRVLVIQHYLPTITVAPIMLL